MKDTIIAFIANELVSGEDITLQSGDDLLGSGLIDSMGIMRLIAFLEKTYSLKIPPEDMVIEHFMTVDTITTYLSTRSAATQS